MLYFFFQAEDGIRDMGVTGVQTCALPICRLPAAERPPHAPDEAPHVPAVVAAQQLRVAGQLGRVGVELRVPVDLVQIGRASGRERVKTSGVRVSFKKT